MKLNKFAATALTATLLAMPMAASAQTSYSEHQRYEREQIRSDHRHHTGVKIIGGSAVGGAVIGGLAGGGKGALIGGAIGAGGGALANHIRKEHDVHKRERRHREYHHYNGR
ncbi:MAG: hypothetical protein V4555_02205 [Acidobacteriota bacterium]